MAVERVTLHLSQPIISFVTSVWHDGAKIHVSDLLSHCLTETIVLHLKWQQEELVLFVIIDFV